MENKEFKNQYGTIVHYLEWKIDNPKGSVVISHGMAEHIERYDDLAKYLNENGYLVVGINQIGHGKNAEKLGHMDKGDFDKCVSNLHELVEIVKEEYKVPTFLLGHSMGSFISQLYAIRFGSSIKGLILSGSTKASGIMKMGAFVATLNCLFEKDLTKPGKFMNNMSFSAYNKGYESVRTEFDWLTRDEKVVDAYIADPLCGFLCSKGFFYNMTHGLAEMGKKKNIVNVPKDLPILIHGGSQDPVSSWGKGLTQLKQQYDDLKLQDVTLFIYEGARHEIYNETNKEEAYTNTLNFLNAHL